MIFNNLIIIYIVTDYYDGQITSYDHHLYNNIFIINLIIMLFYVNVNNCLNYIHLYTLIENIIYCIHLYTLIENIIYLRRKLIR